MTPQGRKARCVTICARSSPPSMRSPAATANSSRATAPAHESADRTPWKEGPLVALTVERPHRLALIEEAAIAAGAGEVLVRVQRAGICGSDMHIYHGSNPFAKYPRVIGHEFSGTVEA